MEDKNQVALCLLKGVLVKDGLGGHNILQNVQWLKHNRRLFLF